ncbi:hypothetical protein GCM10011374_06970 [Kocuria dechangensis]|uniref:Uncharacterized protein n=1 Tax=Kocuria dechangensis TaxID=1176249 RepID=A0A917GIL3_9MICC|nr:hypothetical protein GCM10011374_06970 [Kocuria dechangensis]
MAAMDDSFGLELLQHEGLIGVGAHIEMSNGDVSRHAGASISKRS